jgi:outer membrane protein assembly factor BamB
MPRLSAVALAALLAVTGAASAHAASGSSTTASWRQTNGAGSESRANLDETTLTPATVADATRLHRFAEPATSPGCSTYAPNSPLLSANHLELVSGGEIKQYNVQRSRLSRHVDLAAPDSTNYNNLVLGRGHVVVGGSDCESVSDPNGFLFSYNSTTGAPQWQWNGPGVGDLVESGPTLVVSGGTVGSGNYIDALRISNGATLWSKFFDCFPGTTPIAGGNVIASTCVPNGDGDDVARLLGFRLSNGTRAWARTGLWTVYRADSDTATRAQVYATNPHGNDVALNAQTGARLYGMTGARDVLAADNRRVYATCGIQGVTVCGYAKSDGSKLWTASYVPNQDSPLASVAGGVLYLDDGQALNAATGKLITRLWSSGRASGLAVGRGLVAAQIDGVHTDLYGLSP